MAFVYRLHTPALGWPSVDAVSVAVNAQAGLGAQVSLLPGDHLRIQCVLKQCTTTATMAPFDAVAYGALVAHPQPEVTPTECDAVHKLHRTVTLSTADETEDGALCQVTIADALWWLLGGLLEAPRTGTLWGRAAWRAHTLRRHAADWLTLAETAIAPLPPPQTPQPLPRAGFRPPTAITVYTLPYCRHCRALVEDLTARNLPFSEVDVTQTEGAAAQMMQINEGRRAAPTVWIGQQVLVGPEPDELEAALRTAGLI